MATLPEVMSHVRGWPRALRWSEFPHLTVSRLPPFLGECAADFELITMPMVRQGRGATINPRFAIQVSLDTTPTGTWVVNGNETADLLKHEQGHYDLAGLAAREYARQLLAFLNEGPVDPSVIQRRVPAMNERIEKDLATINDAYDDATKHGTNTNVQNRWNAYIGGHIASFLEPHLSWTEALIRVLR